MTRNGWASTSSCHTFTPWKDSVTAKISNCSMPTTIPVITATIGASTVALTTLDSTVLASEIGSDFQNRMLRSRRSSYSAPRQ